MTRYGAGLLMVVLLLWSGRVSADYQDGLNAYSFGDFEMARQEWLAVVAGPPGDVVPTIYAETHYALGMLYWKGLAVPQDYDMAREWLLKAADLGHAGAQAKIGFMYTDGLTVVRDYQVALEWFQLAAKGGNVNGMYNLGIFYLYGWGVEQDRVMAKQYLAAASTLGDSKSEEALQRLMAEEDLEEAARKAEVEAFAAQIPPLRDLPDIQLEELPVEEISPYGIIKDEKWILQRNPGHYTIQVMALVSLENLMKVIDGHKESLSPLAIYRLENEGRPLFVLVQGDFPDVNSARAARDRFPSSVQRRNNVWIRQFEMVQKLIREERRK